VDEIDYLPYRWKKERKKRQYLNQIYNGRKEKKKTGDRINLRRAGLRKKTKKKRGKGTENICKKGK